MRVLDPQFKKVFNVDYTQRCTLHKEFKEPFNEIGRAFITPVCHRCLEDTRDSEVELKRMTKLKPNILELEYLTEAEKKLLLTKDEQKSKELLSETVSITPEASGQLREDPRKAGESHSGGVTVTRKSGEIVTFATILSGDPELYLLEYEYYSRPLSNMAAMKGWKLRNEKHKENSEELEKPPFLLPTYFWLPEIGRLSYSLIERQSLQSKDWESLVAFRVDYLMAIKALALLEQKIVNVFSQGYEEDEVATKLGFRPYFVRENLKSANKKLRTAMRLYTKSIKEKKEI